MEITASDGKRGETANILRSTPGIGPVASTMLIAKIPKLDQISGEQAAALTGLAPIAHDSGTLRGKRAIGGARRLPWHVMFQAAIVVTHHNPVLTPFADRLHKAENCTGSSFPLWTANSSPSPMLCANRANPGLIRWHP